jgi:Na+-driven multidrug efflux pump
MVLILTILASLSAMFAACSFFYGIRSEKEYRELFRHEQIISLLLGIFLLLLAMLFKMNPSW